MRQPRDSDSTSNVTHRSVCTRSVSSPGRSGSSTRSMVNLSLSSLVKVCRGGRRVLRPASHSRAHAGEGTHHLVLLLLPVYRRATLRVGGGRGLGLRAALSARTSAEQPRAAHLAHRGQRRQCGAVVAAVGAARGGLAGGPCAACAEARPSRKTLWVRSANGHLPQRRGQRLQQRRRKATACDGVAHLRRSARVSNSLVHGPARPRSSPEGPRPRPKSLASAASVAAAPAAAVVRGMRVQERWDLSL